MTPDANLSCYRSDCHGEFAYVGDSNTGTLYECRECGAELEQSGLEKLAEDSGPIGQLATILLEGGE